MVAVITVNRASVLGTSKFQPTTVPVQNPFLTGAGKAAGLARWSESSRIAWQHIKAFGPGEISTGPGNYSWGGLDPRVQNMRDGGQVPGITLCKSPSYLYGVADSYTSVNYDDKPPIESLVIGGRAAFDHFADLAKAIATRYPDVTEYQVWNEMRGFWNYASIGNRWNYEAYTRMFNKLAAAVHSVRPAAHIGGPYPFMNHYAVSTSGATTNVVGLANRAYGWMDQRDMNVISYWLTHQVGGDRLIFDCTPFVCRNDVAPPGGIVAAIQTFYADLIAWIRTLPGGATIDVGVAEFYTGPAVAAGSTQTTAQQNERRALGAIGLMSLVRSGYRYASLWSPQGKVDLGDQGLWRDTVSAGATTYPLFDAFKAINDAFPPGTLLYPVTSSDPNLNVLASGTKVLVANAANVSTPATVNGVAHTVDAYGVHLYNDAGDTGLGEISTSIITVAAAAEQSFTGTGDVTLLAAALAAAGGSASQSGDAIVTLPPLTVAATGVQSFEGEAAVVLPPFAVTGAAESNGAAGAGDVLLAPLAVAAVAGFQSFEGVGDVTLEAVFLPLGMLFSGEADITLAALVVGPESAPVALGQQPYLTLVVSGDTRITVEPTNVVQLRENGDRTLLMVRAAGA